MFDRTEIDASLSYIRQHRTRSRSRRARAKPVRYTDNIEDEEMVDEEEAPKPRSRKRKIQPEDFDPDVEPPTKKRATKASKKDQHDAPKTEEQASSAAQQPDQTPASAENGSAEESGAKKTPKKKATPKRGKKAPIEGEDEPPKPKKPRAKKTTEGTPTSTAKKGKSKQKSALLNSSIQDQESDLLSKYASYSLQELQGMLPRDQYMKIAIQRMLIESPHQVNATNMIVNKELVPIRKSKPTYEEEIKSMMHSWGEVAQPNIETAKLLEAEATKFVQNLLQKLSHEAHKDKSNGDVEYDSEDSTAKEGVVIKKVGVKLDHFARALFPDMKAIRLVEHFLSFLKTSKAFAQHMDDTGADIEAYWAETENGTENENKKKAAKELKQQAMEIDTNANGGTEEHDAHIKADWTAPSIDQLKKLSDNQATGPIEDCSIDKIKEEKLNRLAEREEFSRNMTQAQYIFFENCCKVSFGRPRKKFTEWLKSCCDFHNYKISMQKDVVDALAYLVYNRIENMVRAVKKSQSNSKLAIDPKSLNDYLNDKQV